MLAAALMLALLGVPMPASPASGHEAAVAWEQVRAGLPAAPRGGAPAAAGATVSVAVPDLSAAVDEPGAPAGVRRAACHQLTGLDDESVEPLAACLRHVASHGPGRPAAG